MPDPQIDATTPTTSRISILFVCTGNICRSPLAEVMAKSHFEADRYIFLSAGTHVVRGGPATESSKLIARERGLDLSDHRTAALADLSQPDVVVGMEQHHLVAARRQFPELEISRIRLLDYPVAIADPYGRDLDAYRATADHIEHALSVITVFP